jgi:hypothetical protein
MSVLNFDGLNLGESGKRPANLLASLTRFYFWIGLSPSQERGLDSSMYAP